MVVKFKKDVTYQGKPYFKDDVIENIKLEDIDNIWKLNEKGFIYPITYKDYMKTKIELSKKSKIKEV